MSRLPAVPVTRRHLLAASLPLLSLGLAACAGADSSAPPERSGAEDGAQFPREVSTCGRMLTVPSAPQRLVLLDSAAVPALGMLGALGRVVARAGEFPMEAYRPELREQVQRIPVLSEDIDGTGHLVISEETVIAQEPDLVLGLPDGITRDGMAELGIGVLQDEVYCREGVAASLEDITAQVRQLAAVLGLDGAGEEAIAEITERIRALQERVRTEPVAGPDRPQTAAVLYPTIGGGPLYAYGAASMATPQLELIGLENTFAQETARVFEVGHEPLLAADPDLLVILHQGEDTQQAVQAVRGMPGLEGLRAMQEGMVFAHAFNFTEPASPLAIDGAERIWQWLREHA